MLPLVLAFSLAAPPDTNVVIRHATIHDGRGEKPMVGDVHIVGDRIKAVGQVGKVEGAREIDATGLVVCPGFIDLHTHCDSGVQNTTTKANKNYITQGCTTVVTGNCGSGPVDVAAYFKKLDEQGIGTNVIHLATHNNIREQAMGNENRKPTSAEQAKMEALVDQAMKDGAWGLSTGLIYNPGTYSETEEIIGLAKAAGKHQGIYASHIRDEGTGLLVAIEEAIRIGREGGCPVHISHIKASGKAAHGTSVKAVGVIEAARKKGQVVTADQYPYIASSTSLKATVVPSRYREGGAKEYAARFDDPVTGPKLKADIEKSLNGRAGGKTIQIARYAPNKAWNGKTISAIAEAEKKEPIDIVLEIEKNGGAQIVNFGMSEEDVRVYMKQPWVATASDGGVQTPGDTVPHPRSYGTFPRKIGLYAIEDKVVSLEQAIRSSTGLPADILKLPERGYLKAGYFADVVVFDPKAFRDTATYDKPHQYAAGVKWVFVNGVPAVADGKHQPEALGGRAIRHGK
ncbi:MAG: D-aminoacylase [Fimbriiglobus sp.]|nr:D-aminoacylase [Fimbriiglobus sp.]